MFLYRFLCWHGKFQLYQPIVWEGITCFRACYLSLSLWQGSGLLCERWHAPETYKGFSHRMVQNSLPQIHWSRVFQKKKMIILSLIFFLRSSSSPHRLPQARPHGSQPLARPHRWHPSGSSHGWHRWSDFKKSGRRADKYGKLPPSSTWENSFPSYYFVCCL